MEAEIVGQAFRNGLATNASTKIFSFAGHDLSSTRLFDKRVIFRRLQSFLLLFCHSQVLREIKSNFPFGRGSLFLFVDMNLPELHETFRSIYRCYWR